MTQLTANRFITLSLVLVLLLAGCSLGQAASPSESPAPAASTEPPPEPASQASVTPASETASETSTETALPEITHLVTPGVPIYNQWLPEECNTGFNFNRPGYRIHAPCDSWGTNLLERPVSADLSSFYHYIDILGARVGRSGDWMYASLDLFGAGVPEDDTPYTYFFELDLDQNGRGDILIAATNLALYTTDWTVSGVQAWQDSNGDVGGPTAIRPDGQTGNGYETMLFDQGQGEDPDLAWVRRSPDAYDRIEFAFKPSLLQGKASFLWWAGALHGPFDPGKFDLVDSATEDTLYAVDTTCGLAFGGQSGFNVKFCYIPTGSSAAPEEPDSCIQPPHPDPQNNCWWWDSAACQWICIN